MPYPIIDSHRYNKLEGVKSDKEIDTNGSWDCIDCGKKWPYLSFAFPDQQWRLISDRTDISICGNCTINRLEKIGAQSIYAWVFGIPLHSCDSTGSTIKAEG